jgi:hypothetical protein
VRARVLGARGLRDPEVEELRPRAALGDEHHVRRLHVAVTDAARVRDLQRVGDGGEQIEDLVDRPGRRPLRALA